jgi:hypothetical protein
MADAFALARAAAERRKASAPRKQMSCADCVHLSAARAAPERRREAATRIGAARHWLDASLGALLPLLLQGANLEWRGGSQRSDTMCRENGAARVIASVSEAIQSGSRRNLDCFVAIAPRNDADTRIFTSPHPREWIKVSKPTKFHRSSAYSVWPNSGANASREQLGRRAVAAMQSRETVAHPAVKQALPSNN